MQKIFLLFFLVLFPYQANATVYISQDRGGRIGEYVDKYAPLESSDEKVVISGLCASACTIVLSIPASRICVTPDAVLGFHAAFDYYQASIDNPSQVRIVKNDPATRMLFNVYPAPIKKWIQRHGGLTSPNTMLYLKGKELARLYRPCTGNGFE